MDVEAMMVRITADKKEAAITQKAVAQQEQDANEQAAQASVILPPLCQACPRKPLQSLSLHA